MTTFTKSIFAVELNGKPYAIALPVAAMEEIMAVAAKNSPGRSLDLMPIPNAGFLEEAMTAKTQPSSST